MRYPFAAILLLMTACRGTAVQGEGGAEAGVGLGGAADGGPLDGATSAICQETSEAASTCASDAPDLVYPRPYSCSGGAKPATSEACKELEPTGGDTAFCCDRPRVEWPVATIDVDGGELVGQGVAITAATGGAWTLSFSCSQSSGADPCSIAVKVHSELGGIDDPLDVTGDIGSLTQARSSSDTVSFELVKPGAAKASFKAAPGATLEMTGLANGKRVHGLFLFVRGKKITTDAEFTNPLRIRMGQS
jgi:hypothetical protein